MIFLLYSGRHIFREGQQFKIDFTVHAYFLHLKI